MELRNDLRNWLKGLKALWPYILARTPQNQRFTEEYPDRISSRMSTDLSPRTKGFLRNDVNLCTGCGDCIKICPAKALEMDSEVKVDGSIRVKRFAIDLGRCVTCSLCVEVCPVDSIVHTRNYEAAAYEKQKLVIEFSDRGSNDEMQKVKEKIRLIRAYEVRR